MNRLLPTALVTAAVALAFAPCALAQSGWRAQISAGDWKLVRDATDMVFMRTGPVSGPIHDISLRFERDQPAQGDAGVYLSNTSVYQANCQTRQVRLLRATRYKSHNLSDRLEEVAGGPTEWEAPGSSGVLSFVLTQACGAA